MKKIYLVPLITLMTITYGQTQNLWYENESGTKHITFSNATKGSFGVNRANPGTTNVNNNATVSRFERNGQKAPFIFFNLSSPITNLNSYSISLKARTSIATNGLTNSNKTIRVYLRNSSIGGSSNIYRQRNFVRGKDWQNFTFTFNNVNIPQNVLNAGGYDQMMISFANADTNGLTTIYHIDTIEGGSSMEFNAKWLLGSWGVRLTVAGGVTLNNAVANNANYVSGAQQIINQLPSTGHIITNFSNNAHGYWFTLRTNPYVNIASEIHPDMVPSLANEQIILDVIQRFKNAGKRVILYIATDGPSARSGTPDNAVYKAAWENYYQNNSQFTGNNAQKEGQAYRLLCKGFVERFRDAGVDGYWLDHVGGIPGSLGDFVAMIRDVDPNAAITTNGLLDDGTEDLSDDYFKNTNGQDLFVDTDNASEQKGVDGTGDNINRDYRIKRFAITNNESDYTSGHPTPLALGAPPSSWAYEEYSIPDIAANPVGRFQGNRNRKLAVKHAWIPMRSKWNGPTRPLMFDVEKAYRFVRNTTDGNASITWGNTIQNGRIPADEMAIMTEINTRMSANPKTSFAPYARPEGAFLVGEPQPSLTRIHENQSGFCSVDGTIDNNFNGFTHLGYADTSNSQGSGINWRINGPAGWYTFKWRYSNGPTVNRRAKLIVNGNVEANGISFPTTGSWTTWENTAAVTVYLGGGTKNIRLESSRDQGLAPIDRIDITAANVSRVNCNTSSRLLAISDPDTKKQSISLFPNPAKDVIEIVGDYASIEVLSISGQLIKSFKKPQSNYQINDLPTGLYLVKILDSEGSYSFKKLLKQ